MGRTKVNLYQVPQDGDQISRIKTMLCTLELHTTSTGVEEVLEKAERNHKTIADSIENLLEIEILMREQQRVRRWINNARFPAEKSLEEFDFSFQPQIDQSLIHELASCRFIKKGQNIIFFGPPGVGKTHLSIALGREAVSKGHEVKFVTLERLIEQIGKLDAVGISRLVRTFANIPLLIIDDIDYEDPGKAVSSVLLKIIFRRDEQQVSTIYTSNKSFKDWQQLFSYDKSKAAAAIDRIHNNQSYVINISGQSYRVERSQVLKG